MPWLRHVGARAAAAIVAAWAAAWGPGAHAIEPHALTSTSYIQLFDGMANAQVSALPAGWVFASGTAPTWTSGTQTTTTQYAGTIGTGTLTPTSAGGAYLFVFGDRATGGAKTPGFLSSGGYTSPRSILFGFTNATAGTITSLTLGWSYEKYRNGTRAVDWRFFGSADGSTWTSGTAGNRSFAADANNDPLSFPSSTQVSGVPINGLAIAPGGSYYLRWDYVASAGSSNSQAIGIDTFTLTAVGAATVSGTYWAPQIATGLGGSGTWTSLTSFAVGPTGTAAGLLSTAGPAVFGGVSGTVTIAGTVRPAGMTFSADGYLLSGGAIEVLNTGTVTATAGVSATIASPLVTASGLSLPILSGSGASVVITGSVGGTGGIRKLGPGDLVLAADNGLAGEVLVTAGAIRIGAGGDSGSVPGPVRLLAPDTAVIFDRADDVAVATQLTGTGSLVKEGGNTITLTGSNGLAGTVTVFAGDLVVGDGGTNGSLPAATPLDLADGARFVFDRSDDVVFSGTVAGGGSLVQRGGGSLRLTQAGRLGETCGLRIEHGVVALDRGGNTLVGLLGAGNAVTLGGGTLELSSDGGEETKLLGAALLVDDAGTIAIRKTGVAGDHVTTGFDSPISVADGGSLSFDFRGAFVGPSLPAVRYLGSTTYTGTVTLDGESTITVTNSAGGTADVIFAGPLAGAAGGRLTKSGDQRLTLAGSGSLTGPTSVAEGTLRLASPQPLAPSIVTVAPAGILSVADGTRASVGGLGIEAGGLVDVAAGALTVAAGMPAQELVANLLLGRGDGSWNGTAGITSAAAAAALAASVPRTVGWLDEGDGSVVAAFAAPGDSNLDWSVDILDAADFLAGGKFDSGSAASWNQGDFGYDGVVDILDAADFLSTGLFDAGPYGTSAAVGTIAAVPEPAPLTGCAAVIWLISARCTPRMRRTSAIASGW